MISSFLSVAACLLPFVSAIATPPGYLPSTNKTPSLSFGNTTVNPGSILPRRGNLATKYHPRISYPAESPLQAVVNQPTIIFPTANSTEQYLTILIDSTANLSLPNPASLLWFQSNITFPPSPPSSASFGTSARVPYLAPSAPGHVYIALLYKQPPGFVIPSDFPYNDTFRENFNVSRLAVDFETGGPVAATFFELGVYGMWFLFRWWMGVRRKGDVLTENQSASVIASVDVDGGSDM
ncbi:MAG: hypothetical protein Q9216_005100 [Gyalolechia sp. 2 TL-2023]